MSHRLAPWVIFSVLLMFFWRPVEDYDIWFYMVSGREVAATGHIPDTMFYLLPLLGEPASYIEWGFGLIYHLAYIIGGYTGMNVLNATIGATTLWLAYFAAIGKREQLHPIALLALALVALWILVRINYRAETALLLAMAVTLFSLEKYAEQGSWRWLVLIPIAGWLLAQMHPSVVLLMPVLGAYAIEFFFHPPAGCARARAVALLAATGVATLALACLNPYGWHQVMLPFIIYIGLSTTTKELTADLTEFLPVMNTEYATDFVIMVILGIVSLIFQRGRRVSSGLLMILFGALTFLYVRNIGLFALMLLSPLVRFGLNVPTIGISPRLRLLGASLVLTVLLVLPLWQGKLGSGIKPGVFPEQSVTYMKTHLPDGGNVLNFYDYGGYLAWALNPAFLVFVDGHATGVNLANQQHDRIFRADPGWENAVAHYRIDAIFTPTVMQYSGSMIPLVGRLAASGEWILVEREPSGLLFLRADLVAGPGLDKRQIWEQMIEEGLRESVIYPDHPDPWAAMATAYRALGNGLEAEAAERQYRQLSKPAP